MIELGDTFNMAAYLVDRHVQEGRGARPAVRAQSKALTYAGLLAYVNRAANAFADLGLELEQRCLLLLPDCPEFHASFLGAMKIGAVPVPANRLATAKDFLYYLNDSRAKIAVVHPEVWDRLQEIKSELRYLKHFVMVGPDVVPGCLSFDQITAAASPERDPEPTSPDDASYWLFTSGTTGTPKGVIHLHHDMLHCVGPYTQEIVHTTPDDVFLSSSVLFTSYGLVNSLYLPLYAGASVVLNPDRPAPATLYHLLETERPTVFCSVPTSIGAMLADESPHDLSSLRLCISAGEPLPGALFERWKERFGVEILDGIGSTEFGYIFISNRPGHVRHGSAGQLIPPHESKVLDLDGQPVPPGEIGELYMRSDSVAAGYWNKHDRSKETFSGDWLRTHDNFLVDEDGYYFYQGRADDLIKVSGLYVSPSEVEGVLLQHEAVAECAVVGAPDAEGLIKSKAFVVLRAGAEPSDQLAQELQQFTRDRLAHYKYPRMVEFVPELPKTVMGKIQRFKLRT
ncbi:MAG TPA: benzoate-CoA ligase family protein [Chloroflexota bacterium]|nr:benzoate-CoA ligase family protein [Chloroflexota bacterium]